MGDDEVRKRELAHFVEAVERAVTLAIGRRPAPLVIAAVEELAALWREKTHLPATFAGVLEGNADRESPETLRDRASPLLESRLSAARD